VNRAKNILLRVNRRAGLRIPAAMFVAFTALAPARAAASAACETGRLPSRDYLDVVRAYVSGDRTLAIARIGAWGEARLGEEISALRDAATRRATCLDSPSPEGFEFELVRAAILLHLDREILENFKPPVGETMPQCRVGQHARAVRKLAPHLAGLDVSSHGFLRRFFLATARFTQWSHCLANAREWAREGTRLFPRDSLLWLTLGIAFETDGALLAPLAPTARGMGSRAAREFLSRAQMKGERFDEARRAFTEALRANPDEHEARARLGRLLWRAGRAADARRELEDVLGRNPAPRTAFLAHLFLGRILEDEQDLDAAERRYDAALALDPASEPAAFARAHVRSLRGDAEGSRALIEEVLDRRRRGGRRDAYSNYLMAHTHDGAEVLDALRLEVSR
jgi:tetratricopeptide (TPR) repeat protein